MRTVAGGEIGSDVAASLGAEEIGLAGGVLTGRNLDRVADFGCVLSVFMTLFG